MKKARIAEFVLLVLMFCQFFTMTIVGIKFSQLHIATVAVSLFLSLTAMAFTLLLYVFCVSSYTWNARDKYLFESILASFFLYCLFAAMTITMTGRPGTHDTIFLLYTLQYSMSSLYWIACWHFQKGKFRSRLGDKLCGYIFYASFAIYTGAAIVNYFTGFCFTVDEQGVYELHSYFLFYLTLLWFFIYLIIALSMRCDLKSKLTLMSYSLIPSIEWLLFIPLRDSDFYFEISYTLGLILYLIPLYLLFFNIYLERRRLVLVREKELELSRANAMMLKISPHFISNTMSSIVALCYPSAPKAGELATKFARYLRDNYADISDEPMIPFCKELEHIRNYLAVEEFRFSGLRVEYDIGADEFLLPTLTVQPLVENAVRHGISKRPDASGTVTISSAEEKSSYIIRIRDDGVGFAADKPRDGKHIGIANAKARLAMLCEGTLKITSEPGLGTLCEIRIPKGSAKNHDCSLH